MSELCRNYVGIMVTIRDLPLPEFEERQKRAIEYLKSKGKITNKEYQELCAVNRITAFRDLSELVEKKIVEKIGKTGRWIHYILKR